MLERGAQRERVLALLEVEGGVSEESVRRVAERTRVPEAEIWGAGLFYTLINRPGRRIRLCDGLSCRMAGADELTARLERQGKSCERVSCLGQCDRAPVTLDEELELVTYEGRPRGVTPDDPELPMNLAGAVDLGYGALDRARELGPRAVIDALERSGLQGRGGAGFPAHVKWRAVREQSEPERYVVCNADEGEPGTFKDRWVMERNP